MDAESPKRMCQFPMGLVHSTVHRQHATILAHFQPKSSTFWRQSKQISEMTKTPNSSSSNSSFLVQYVFTFKMLLIDRIQGVCKRLLHGGFDVNLTFTCKPSYKSLVLSILFPVIHQFTFTISIPKKV